MNRPRLLVALALAAGLGAPLAAQQNPASPAATPPARVVPLMTNRLRVLTSTNWVAIGGLSGLVLLALAGAGLMGLRRRVRA